MGLVFKNKQIGMLEPKPVRPKKHRTWPMLKAEQASDRLRTSQTFS